VETARGDVPLSPDGSFWIAYTGSTQAHEIAATTVFDKTLPPGTLRGTLVYIGAPDEMVRTPTGIRSVAEVHAEAAENLLLGMSLRRPAGAVAAEMFCLLLFGAAGVFFIIRFGLRTASIFVVCIAAGMFFVSWQLYAREGVLFDAAGISFGLAMVLLGGVGVRQYDSLIARARLKMAFAESLPRPALRKIARNPQLLKLDGESRVVTYLSCGVRGFAEIAESFDGDPTAFTRLMQRVLEPLMDEAMSHGGAIDKLTNDGFTAYWNAPLDNPEHAIRASEAASGMMNVIAKTNEIITRERRGDGVALQPVEIGIGISTGPCIAGGIRAHGRTVYSVNGDCVALASRIQRISGQYGPAVIVSEDTRNASDRGFAFLEVDYIAIDANDEPVKLYAMLGNPVMRASPRFRALATFHDHIFQAMRTQQWERARELIGQCRKLSGASQKLYDLHLARIAYFEENPPEENWDGVFRAILK
jgi:adenylate cyclase